MHLVGFVIRIYHDARSSECQMWYYSLPSSASSVPDYTQVSVIYKSRATHRGRALLKQIHFTGSSMERDIESLVKLNKLSQV